MEVISYHHHLGNVILVTGKEEYAKVYVAKMSKNRMIEFVDALDPRYSRNDKWVITVSTQYGCPVGCIMCDAGTTYKGNLTAEEILWQIDTIVYSRYPDGVIPVNKFKVHFARMGEPSLNPNVLVALQTLRHRYKAPNLIACIATVAPFTAKNWFLKLIQIKKELYRMGAFQLQFSVNSTNQYQRDYIMPIKKFGLEEIAEYGQTFFQEGDRKIVLNFAVAEGWEISPDVIARIFDPNRFLVKLTPVNPGPRANLYNCKSLLSYDCENGCDNLANQLRCLGFDVIISIGVKEEVEIKSNCGQMVYANGLES